jgi:hypothetical protein
MVLQNPHPTTFAVAMIFWPFRGSHSNIAVQFGRLFAAFFESCSSRTLTLRANEPSRAGEEIRTPDVQLGKTHITIDAERHEKPIKQGVFGACWSAIS